MDCRYKKGSCNSLEPQYVTENWQYPGGSSEQDPLWQEDDLSLFDRPRKSRERNPPYNIQIDFKQYRREREYQGEGQLLFNFPPTSQSSSQLKFAWFSVRLETFEYYDSVLLQARGEDKQDGNASLVGWFELSSHSPVKFLHCHNKRKSG